MRALFFLRGPCFSYEGLGINFQYATRLRVLATDPFLWPSLELLQLSLKLSNLLASKALTCLLPMVFHLATTLVKPGFWKRVRKVDKWMFEATRSEVIDHHVSTVNTEENSLARKRVVINPTPPPLNPSGVRTSSLQSRQVDFETSRSGGTLRKYRKHRVRWMCP